MKNTIKAIIIYEAPELNLGIGARAIVSKEFENTMEGLIEAREWSLSNARFCDAMRQLSCWVEDETELFRALHFVDLMIG